MRDLNSNQTRELIRYGKKVFQGNLDDPDNLTRAMDAVYGVFSVQPYTANEIQQGVAVSDAAKRQGVSDFVYTSVGSTDEETGIPRKWENRTFSLAGDGLSMQIADAFDRVTAQDVKYVQVPWDQFEKIMGQEMTVIYRWFEERGVHFNIEQLRREYPLTHTFNRWLEAHWYTTAVAAR